MAYLNRQRTRRSTGSAELIYLVIILAAGVGTAWWAGHKLGMDLSGLTTAASVLGFTQPNHHVTVGYTPGRAVQVASDATAYCSPGQSPAFVFGLADLKQYVGDSMGTPVECEHAASDNGDTLQ